MGHPPPHDGPWQNEKQPIPEKADDAALLLPKPIAIKAVCTFHLTHPAYTDSKGVHHPVSIYKIKRATLAFDSTTTLSQFYELARATFHKLFHCPGCCAPRTFVPPSSSSSAAIHPAHRQAAWEELKQHAAKMTHCRPKRIITWTPALWEAELQGAIAAAAASGGKITPVFKLPSWFFQTRPRKLTPEERRRVPLLARLRCLAKGHFLRWVRGVAGDPGDPVQGVRSGCC
jgi:hypothetical protein